MEHMKQYKPGDFVRSSSGSGPRICYIQERIGGDFWALQLLSKTKAVVHAALRAQDILGLADTEGVQALATRDLAQRLPKDLQPPLSLIDSTDSHRSESHAAIH